MIKELLCQIFSQKCQLQNLYLDLSNERRSGPLHQCLSINSSLSFDSIGIQSSSSCLTLRYLNIRLNATCFFQNLIEHVPNLEQISVEFIDSIVFDLPSEWNMKASRKYNQNWFDKVKKEISLLQFHLFVIFILASKIAMF